MILTADSVYYYLHDLGYFSADAVVNQDFHVANLSRRNVAFRVTSRSRPQYVVKQTKNWTEDDRIHFETESRFYKMTWDDSVLKPLAQFLGNCLVCDDLNETVVLQLPPKCESLEDQHLRVRNFSRSSARLLGDTLGAFHSALSDSEIEQVQSSFHNLPPSGLLWYLMEDIGEESGGVAELCQFVYKNSLFDQTFQPLRESWRRERLINGDMKFAHCILSSASGDGGRKGPLKERLYFIDWETTNIGDPCWDAAAILFEYVRSWILSMPKAAGLSYRELTGRAGISLEETKAAMHDFWWSYESRVSHSASESEARSERTVQFTAAWLLMTAYRVSSKFQALDDFSKRLSQFSLDILTSPEEFSRMLLG